MYIKINKYIIYGIIALAIAMMFMRRDPLQKTKQQQQEEQEQLKKNQQQQEEKQQNQKQKQLNCDPKIKQKTVQFDYSYIRKTHKEHLVRDYFDAKPCEWNVNEFNMNKHFDLVWVFSPHQIKYERINHSKGQMANHIENLQKLVDKSQMVKTLQMYEQKNKSNGKIYKKGFQGNNFMETYVPKTYTVNLDQVKYNQEEKIFLKDPEQGIWIVKPTNQFGGKGIKVIKDVQQLKQQIQQQKQSNNKQNGKLIVQKYIENPLLIEKKKFDFRCYVFIASTFPKYVALYHPGFIRRTLFEYTNKVDDKDDSFVHLTNVEAQKKHPQFEQLSDQLMMSMQEFENYFLNEAKYSQQQLDQVYYQIKAISAYTVQAAQQQLVNKKGYFQVLGFDYMLDEDLNVYLIEINKSPSWQILNQKQQFKEKMLFKFIDTVQDIHENEQLAVDKIQENIKDTDFEIIINEYTDTIFGQ